MRTIKVILVLAILGSIGLVGFAYLGDMSPQPREITIELAPVGGGNGG